MKETFKLGRYLFIVCTVAGFALAGTNYLTEKKIQEQKLKAEQEALIAVLRNATDFKPQHSYLMGYDPGHNPVGYILKVKAAGYSSPIEALVGIDRKFKITGLKIISQNETPGLGSKIAEPGFLDQFIGKVSAKVLLKKDGGSIDGVTAATVSSRAITNAIRKQIDEFKTIVQ